MPFLNDAGPPQALQRVLVVMFCLVGTALAIVSGLDRASPEKPALSRFVPAPFAAVSLRVRASRALDQHDYGSAEALARTLIRAAPVEPESTAILGSARLGLGDANGAERAFLVAGQFGWRTPITQYYWMREALAVGDYRVASLRLDAMLRQDPKLVSVRDLMEPLESTEAGRQALAQRLAGRPSWLELYVSSVFDLPVQVISYRADVADRMAALGVPLGCQGAGPLVTALVNYNQARRAHRMWRQQCPSAGTGLLADPDFANLEVHNSFSPFDWVVIGDSDVSLSLSNPEDGARHLVLASSASFTRKILNQMVILPPGTYRLSWQARTDSGQPSPRIAVAASCQADAADWLPARGDAASGIFTADFTVDPSCPARWIGFAILPGSETLSLGQIGLRRMMPARP